MIEYEKFIYLDVHKTGSTHINSLLSQITESREIFRSRHTPITSIHPFQWKGGKLVFSTVRNPWDWYVSMWAYGQSEGNPLHGRIRAAVGAQAIKAYYDSENPTASFPLWLNALHDPDFLRRILPGQYGASRMAHFLGFYTYRFMRVTTPYPDIFLRWPFLRSVDGAIGLQRRFAMYDVLLNMETLDQDFADFAVKYREDCGFKAQAVDVIKAKATARRNVSARTLPSYRDYYTDGLRDLVANRDRLFVEMFGYQF